MLTYLILYVVCVLFRQQSSTWEGGVGGGRGCAYINKAVDGRGKVTKQIKARIKSVSAQVL